ncbi:50S ribosomal protein L11 methyltransferase [Candidatus Woesearchaeota archaeon]|nr:50S ribosomal protein L11 methyltransferase [Candidatus Woesearchaeota archaeon]
MKKDITTILNQHFSQIDKPLVVDLIDETYSVKDYMWDNWFGFALLAFQNLAKKQNVESFVSIGAGPGIDTICAYHAFSGLKMLIGTDIDKVITDVMKRNIECNTKNVQVKVLTGNLYEPLRETGIMNVDAIYENLPNIPEETDTIKLNRAASVYRSRDFSNAAPHSTFLQRYLLESHFIALRLGRKFLSKGGSMILSMGGRVPFDFFSRMVLESGYGYEELVAGFKLQTEPWEVLPAYAEAEKSNEKEFDFYDYEQAIGILDDLGQKPPFTKYDGNLLKELLDKARISAVEAYRRYQQDPNARVGHTVHMIRAIY